MTALYAPLPGSARTRASGQHVSTPDPDARLEVSVYLKAPDHPGAPRAALRKLRESQLAPHLSGLRKFATEHGLEVTLEDPARRLVKLAGYVKQFEAAFKTELQTMEHQGCTFRAREGLLSVPAELADQIESVLGLDSRPAATPKIVFPRQPQAASAHLPSEVAALYEFPKTSGLGKGQCVALIEVGGGYTDADNLAAFAAMHLPAPAVVAVPVSGGSNAPGGTDGADGEVALDIQVCGGAAPGAKIAVYFAPNTDQGFADAITAAIHDETHKPTVISISWGSAEAQWTAQAIATMNAAFADASSMGVSVCAASGDSLATDGVDDGAAHVDFPASSPYVLGCGGTRIDDRNGKLTAETVWNSEGGGTGGGVSSLFALPDYEATAHVPVSVSSRKPGRGVPDVAADADPNSGYLVIVAGSRQVIGGTSASAPLWAGLIALLNEIGGPVGQPHSLFYRSAQAFRDITIENNRVGSLGYPAALGRDACTGLGSPNGGALADLIGKPVS